MRIIKNRAIVRTDWLPDSHTPEPDAAQGRILALEEWMEAVGNDASTGQARELPGVFLEPGDDPGRIREWIHGIPVIAVNTGNFADGRVYSLAIELRSFYLYEGEIRAIGAIPDNLSMMEQCGFNAFDLQPGLELEEAIPYLTEIGFDYPVR